MLSLRCQQCRTTPTNLQILQTRLSREVVKRTRQTYWATQETAQCTFHSVPELGEAKDKRWPCRICKTSYLDKHVVHGLRDPNVLGSTTRRVWDKRWELIRRHPLHESVENVLSRPTRHSGTRRTSSCPCNCWIHEDRAGANALPKVRFERGSADLKVDSIAHIYHF